MNWNTWATPLMMTMGEGERGEKGDQGQHGQDGKPGKTGERGPSSRKGLIGYVIMAIFFCLALFIMWHNDAEVEAARKERVQQLNQINKMQCAEIEAIKKQLRIEAVENYERLDETLSLLRLERTPEIENRAKMDRDTVLKRFREGTCPRQRIE